MKEIGLILRKRREEKKFSLETVNRRTHIPLKYLIALEEGNLSAFPAEVYFTGSLRKYAGFLGLDPEQLMESYRRLVKAPEQEAAPAAEKEKRQESGRRAILAAAAGSAVIILIILGAVLAFIVSRSRQAVVTGQQPQPETPPAVSTATVPVPPQESTAAETAPKKSTATVPAPRPAPPKAVVPPSVSTSTVPAQPGQNALSLHIRTTQPSWTKVTADDAVVFQGTMGPGESRTWPARERFYLVVGYAPAVSVTLNGRPIDVRSAAVQDVAEVELGWKDVTGPDRP